LLERGPEAPTLRPTVKLEGYEGALRAASQPSGVAKRFGPSRTSLETRSSAVRKGIFEAPRQSGVLISLICTEDSAMNIRPLQDRVVLKRDDPQQRSPGGILIPATAGEKPTEGRVVAVGQGKVLANGKVRPTDLKAGDRVLFGKYSGTEVKLNGEELIVAREEDIMAVVEEA